MVGLGFGRLSERSGNFDAMLLILVRVEWNMVTSCDVDEVKLEKIESP